uniref:Large ribosomal subunit protein bL32c n=1 Tax=Hildenbrandia rivularis TaxID=135206 RepID=A0A1C9CFM4_9FLOR|nr:ribosomal protein L32 [Hildenbrandia rivularis]AOM67157.1 ribosomal protein L32 [Hildenbrandia rivularis]
MAVPKKRTSKSKNKSRKANWKRQVYYKSKKALSLARSTMTGKSTSFIYTTTNSSL